MSEQEYTEEIQRLREKIYSLQEIVDVQKQTMQAQDEELNALRRRLRNEASDL